VTTCQLCEADIPEGHQVEVRGKSKRDPNAIICANCASGIERRLQAETENPNQENLFTLIFWAIALWAAFSTPARRHLRRAD